MNEKICASIVLYNPDVERLKNNFMAIYRQVKHVFVYDNGSLNYNECEIFLSLYENVTFIHSKENLGLAYALNYLCDLALKSGYEWIVTLDQDSIVEPFLIEEYKKYILEDVAQITCYIRDINNEKNDYELRYEEIRWCITSGTFMNLFIWEKVGKFDEQLFIDGIDYDFGLIISENGYKTVRIPYVGLNHEIGKISKNIRIFGKEHPVYNHNHIRKYYIARNSIYVARKHRNLSVSKSVFRVIGRLIFDFVFEKQKFKKLRYALKGMKDGFRMKVKR